MAFDPFSAILLAGATIAGSAMQSEAAKQATEAQKKAAEEQMKLAQEQFAAEQEELERQKQKEQATTDANADALGDVFGSKQKKKKSVDETYFGDL